MLNNYEGLFIVQFLQCRLTYFVAPLKVPLSGYSLYISLFSDIFSIFDLLTFPYFNRDYSPKTVSFTIFMCGYHY